MSCYEWADWGSDEEEDNYPISLWMYADGEDTRVKLPTKMVSVLYLLC